MASTALRFVIVAATLAVVISGCDCSGAPVASCRTSSECRSGFVCRDGRCSAGMDGSAGDAAVDGDGGRRDGGAAGACTVSPVPAAFMSPALELHWRGTGWPFPDLEQVIVSPVVIDVVEDGPDDVVPEIVFVSYATFQGPAVLRVVSGRPPYATLLTLAGDGGDPVTDDTRATPSLRFDAHPAAGDLDGDGAPEIVALLEAGGAVAWRRDGTELWHVDGTELPRAAVLDNASVAIADLDQDGSPEVVVGNVVLDGRTGVQRWAGPADAARTRRGRSRASPTSFPARLGRR